MKIDSLIRAGWLIPAEPEGLVLEDHGLVIEENKILDILPWQAAQRQYTARQTYDLYEHIVIPGLINCHTHSAMSLLRGIADDLPLMDWLQKHIWPLESRWVDEHFVATGTRLAIAEMLRGGTTCFNDMYFFPETSAREAQALGMRATIGLILTDFATNWAETPDEYFNKGLALHDELRNNALISTAFAPHAPYTVGNSSLERMRILAEELSIPIHMHVHETATEVENALNADGKRPLQRLQELNLLSDAFLGVHMVHLSDAEILQYAQSGAHVVHCPSSNMKLASGFCPVDQLHKAGINIALGTDSAASNNQLDMLTELRTAALLAKAVAADASAVPAASALSMATINGAKALGIDQVTGSLRPGKQADICAIRVEQLENMPMFQAISHLAYTCQRHQVTEVWVAGQHLVQSSQLNQLDIAELKSQVLDWQYKLSGSQG